LWMKLNVAPQKGRDRARKLDSLSVPFRMKRWYIRWGVWRWDIFQSLWGWNYIRHKNVMALIVTFNSFEDETELLWWIFWIDKFAFNSFEDETTDTCSIWA